MVTVATLLKAYALYKAGTGLYKQYKRSNKGKSKRKRKTMYNMNIGWGN